MFEEMFKMKLGFFPTLREIRDGLIGGQLCELDAKRHTWCDNTRFESIRRNYVDKWQMIFKFKDLGDLDKPLTLTVLKNPDHPVTQHILYIYTMASFVYP